MKAFFIVGVQRSGTTLLSVMLSQHPAILLERRSLAFRIISCFKSLRHILPFNYGVEKKALLSWLVKNDDKGRLAELINSDTIKEGDSIQAIIKRSISEKLAKEGKQIWGDKSPNLQHFLGDLKLLMPAAKIIHIVRDGRPTAYSLHKRGYQHLLLSAQQWVDGNTCSLVNQQMVGEEQYKIIKYEDLLRNPESEMRSVCEFLEIPFAPAIIQLEDKEIDQDKRYVKTFFDQSKIDGWKKQLTKQQVEKVEKIQGPLLERFGYELQSPQSSNAHRPLPFWRRFRYTMSDNFRQLFRSKRMAMVNRENVEVKLPLKTRIYTFFRVIAWQLLAEPLKVKYFSRFYYRERYYPTEDQKTPE